MTIATLKPYPGYRSSCVEWLGDVPAHWERVPGGPVFTKKKSQMSVFKKRPSFP